MRGLDLAARELCAESQVLRVVVGSSGHQGECMLASYVV